MEIKLTPIGKIHTPYIDDAPYVDYEDKDGDFYLGKAVLLTLISPSLSSIKSF